MFGGWQLSPTARGFRSGRYGDGIFGLLGGRQNLPLATVIDSLVVRGTYVSGMASARPLHDVRDFAMTSKPLGDPNQLAIMDMATGREA
jgi:hypothetical protein